MEATTLRQMPIFFNSPSAGGRAYGWSMLSAMVCCLNWATSLCCQLYEDGQFHTGVSSKTAAAASCQWYQGASLN
ncbi:hypothetical protein SUGI_0729120 [Cryptomeria japonica]|nr:hypothetical protein SUGI_0729120 [Cryptomeria japonica]